MNTRPSMGAFASDEPQFQTRLCGEKKSRSRVLGIKHKDNIRCPTKDSHCGSDLKGL